MDTHARRQSTASLALIPVLLQLSFNTRYAGGFEKPTDKAAALSLANALLSQLVHADQPDVVLFSGPAIQRDKQTCIPTGGDPIILEICSSGTFDLSGLRSCVDKKGYNHAGAWLNHMAKQNISASPTFMELRKFARDDSSNLYKWLYCQLLWAIGQRLDDCFVKARGCEGSDDFKATSTNRAMPVSQQGRTVRINWRALEWRCVANHCLYCLAPQTKSRVDSTGMFSSPFALPNDAAWWGAPQDLSSA